MGGKNTIKHMFFSFKVGENRAQLDAQLASQNGTLNKTKKTSRPMPCIRWPRLF